MVVATNYYKLSGLKEHKFILLQFWCSEVQNLSRWSEIKVSPGLVPSGGPKGKSTFLPFPAARGWLPTFLGSYFPSVFKASHSSLSPIAAL